MAVLVRGAAVAKVSARGQQRRRPALPLLLQAPLEAQMSKAGAGGTVVSPSAGLPVTCGTCHMGLWSRGSLSSEHVVMGIIQLRCGGISLGQIAAFGPLC